MRDAELFVPVIRSCLAATLVPERRAAKFIRSAVKNKWKDCCFSTNQAESLLRPFALLALMTALPPRVAIRALKPWVRLRRKLLG